MSNRRIQPEKSDDLQVIECGTAQSAIPIIVGGGGEKQKPKSSRPKKKNKLPGVSAHQKSVAEFFSKTTPKIISTSTEPVDSEEYLVCEDVLEREYQLARAARQKLPWCYGMAELSLYVCDV